MATPDAALPSRLAAAGALLLATAAAGSTFVVTKSSLDQLAPATFVVWRFGIAALVLVAGEIGVRECCDVGSPRVECC